MSSLSYVRYYKRSDFDPKKKKKMSKVGTKNKIQGETTLLPLISKFPLSCKQPTILNLKIIPIKLIFYKNDLLELTSWVGFSLEISTFRSSRPEVFLKRVFWYNFIEITLRHRCSPVNLLHIFRTTFLKNTTRGLHLYFHFSTKGEPIGEETLFRKW